MYVCVVVLLGRGATILQCSLLSTLRDPVTLAVFGPNVARNRHLLFAYRRLESLTSSRRGGNFITARSIRIEVRVTRYSSSSFYARPPDTPRRVVALAL